MGYFDEQPQQRDPYRTVSGEIGGPPVSSPPRPEPPTPVINAPDSAWTRVPTAKFRDETSAPANATINPSLLQARQAPTFDAPQTMAPSGFAVPGAPGIIREGNSYSGEGTAPNTAMNTEQANEFFGAKLAAMRAAEDQKVQQNNDHLFAQAARATAWQNNEKAQREAHVAAWRAENGADVVLSPRGRNGISGERIMAGRIADGANARAMGSAAALAAADAAVAGSGRATPIDDFAKQQQTLQATQQGILNRPAVFAAQEAAQTGLAAQKLDVATRKQIADLDGQIAAEKDPAKLSVLHNKRLALAGKAPDNKVAVIDVDTGQKDAMGQPIFKKAAVNLATGELMNGGGGKANDPTAALRALPKEQAVQQAKAAIARGAKLEDVNARLKAAGHAPL